MSAEGRVHRSVLLDGLGAGEAVFLPLDGFGPAVTTETKLVTARLRGLGAEGPPDVSVEVRYASLRVARWAAGPPLEPRKTATTPATLPRYFPML